MPASIWKSAALGKFGLAGHLRPFPNSVDPPESQLGPWALSLLCWSALCAVSSVFLVRVPCEACAHVCSQPFCALGFEPSPSAGWPLSCPPWRPCKPLLHWSPWSRSSPSSPPRGLPLASHTSVPARVPVPPCPRPVTSRPRGSILVNQRRPTGLSVKSRPLCLLPSPFLLLEPPALSSRGVQGPQHAALPRRSRGPPKCDSARGTSIGDACGGTSSVRCCVRCSLKHSCTARCFPVVPIPPPTVTSTTRTTSSCSCSVTPPWHLRCCPACVRP